MEQIESSHSPHSLRKHSLNSDTNANENFTHQHSKVNGHSPKVLSFVIKNIPISESTLKINNNTEDFISEPNVLKNDSNLHFVSSISEESVTSCECNSMLTNGEHSSPTVIAHIESCSTESNGENPEISSSRDMIYNCLNKCPADKVRLKNDIVVIDHITIGESLETACCKPSKSIKYSHSNDTCEVNRSASLETFDLSQPGPSTFRKRANSNKETSRVNETTNSLSYSDESSDSSSDIGNDDSLTSSDDGCVYTYKGGDVADLPDCFFKDINDQGSDDIRPPSVNIVEVLNPRSRSSSPEMDYLEMDFDPGPFCEADLDSNVEIEENSCSFGPCILEKHIGIKYNSDCTKSHNTGKLSTFNNEPHVPIAYQAASLPFFSNSDIDVNRPSTSKDGLDGCTAHSLLYDDTISRKITEAQTEENFDCFSHLHADKPVPLTMIWDEKEAIAHQYATSVYPSIIASIINTMNALNIRSFIDWSQHRLMYRQECNKVSLPEYLLSRSRLFSSNEDIMSGLIEASKASVYTRFFPTWPEREFPCSHWLSYWLHLGVIPIVTIPQLRMQKGSILIDTWNHRMVFGVGPDGVYLTDKVQCVPENILRNQLCSDSVVAIKRSDILAHWHPDNDLRKLATIKDYTWHRLNVLGKVVNIIREDNCRHPEVLDTSAGHIFIPTTCKAGVTLTASLNNQSACETLKKCTELPFKNRISFNDPSTFK